MFAWSIAHEQDAESCLVLRWMTIPSTGVRVSKMALHLCHSSLRPRGGATAAICWSHHWLWHHYYSPAVLTGHIAVRKAFMSKMDRWWIILTLWLIFFSDFRTMPLSHPTSAKKNSLNISYQFKACLKTHKGPQSHFAVVYHLRTFIWTSYVPFFFCVAWQMPPLNLVPLREWMHLFNEHRSNYHNRETIKETNE